MSTIRGLAGLSLAVLATLACNADKKVSVQDPVGAVSIVAPTAPPIVLSVGETHQFTAEVRLASGALIDRAYTITYSSSDPAVATVSNSGLATAAGPGTVTITATVEGVEGTADIAVTEPVAEVRIVPETATLDPGGTVQLTATAYDAGGEVLTAPVAFASGDPAVATVSETGLVTAVGAGQTAITASSGAFTVTATITVLEPVSTVDLQLSATLITVGETAQALATPRAADGTALNRPVQYSSSDPAVATIDDAGLVTGVGAGSTTISASSGGKQGEVQLDVQAAAASVTITSDAHGQQPLPVGSTWQLTATVRDAAGNVLDRNVTWSSSNEGIVLVDQTGVATGVAAGTAIVTATSGSASGTLSIRVADETAEE